MTEQEARDIGMLIATESNLKKERLAVLVERIGDALVRHAAIDAMPLAVTAWWERLSPTARAALLTALYEGMQGDT